MSRFITFILLVTASWQLISATMPVDDDGKGPGRGLQSIDETKPVDKWDDKPQTYGVIVDCGSSGTRAHIYQWNTDLDYPELLHDIAPMMENGKEVNKKFQPSLAWLADKSLEERQKYIKRVAEYIESKIPSSRHAFTVIYMMATAGMRLLDEKLQIEIMQDVRNYIKNNYNFRDVTTSVISGADEGMYRWISVNAKAKRFLEDGTDGRTKTYGVIEMGGASVQVVYQLKPGKGSIIGKRLAARNKKLRSIYVKQIVEPQISRHDKPENVYELHSTTFLGFGGDSAHQAYLDLLIHNHYTRDYMKRFLEASSAIAKRAWSNFVDCFSCRSRKIEAENEKKKKKKSVLTIGDPCAPRGFVSDELKKPTRMLHNKNQTIGFIVDEDDEKQGATFPIRVVGTGNYNRCKKLVERMLWTAKRERLNCVTRRELAAGEGIKEDTCTMELLGEHFVAFDSMDFVGIGDFYHTTNTMLEMAGVYDGQAIRAKTRDICNSSKASLEKRFTEIATNKNSKISERIHQECFRAVWVDTFLVKGLMMGQHYGHFRTLDEIGDDDPEWTWGAVVDKSLAIEVATESASTELIDQEGSV